MKYNEFSINKKVKRVHSKETNTLKLEKNLNE
jgi:hypothetical protein